MAEPHLRNGYTRIANELLEAICRLNISGSEMRILFYIIRRTYGFNRTYAELSLSDLADGIGTSKDNISRTLKKLRKANIIDHRPNKGTTPQTLSVNKNYDEWNVDGFSGLQSSKKTTVVRNDNTSVVRNDDSSAVKNDNTRVVRADDHTYKDIKENIKESFKESKHAYGRSGKVLLEKSEYDELVRDYGEETAERYISRMDNFISARGADIRDCYSELLIWLDRDNVRPNAADPLAGDKYAFVFNNF